MDAQFQKPSHAVWVTTVGGRQRRCKTLPPEMSLPAASSFRCPDSDGFRSSSAQPWGPAITEFLPKTQSPITKYQGLFARFWTPKTFC